MKPVLLQPPQPSYTLAANSTPAKYYGVSMNGVNKGFIIQRNYKCGKFTMLFLDLLTQGNCSTYETNTFQELIAKTLQVGWEVLEFDTPQELMKWLSE